MYRIPILIPIEEGQSFLILATPLYITYVLFWFAIVTVCECTNTHTTEYSYEVGVVALARNALTHELHPQLDPFASSSSLSHKACSTWSPAICAIFCHVKNVNLKIELAYPSVCLCHGTHMLSPFTFQRIIIITFQCEWVGRNSHINECGLRNRSSLN